MNNDKSYYIQWLINLFITLRFHLCKKRSFFTQNNNYSKITLTHTKYDRITRVIFKV